MRKAIESAQRQRQSSEAIQRTLGRRAQAEPVTEAGIRAAREDGRLWSAYFYRQTFTW